MSDNREYDEEDVLKHAREAFAETVRLKVQQLYRYIPKGTNSALTGHYVEELVRGFVRKWLGQKRLVSGTFYSTEAETAKTPPLQIDGIVYDPEKGPLILEEGGFVVVHPAFCTNVIEIKTSIESVNEFEERLRRIAATYMHHLTAAHVMGIVIYDADAIGASTKAPRSEEMPAYTYFLGGWCPIFILFTLQDGEFIPHYDAITAMIRSIYTHQYSGRNYLS
jgi:hypothetical protein